MRLIRVQKVWLICAPFREGGVSDAYKEGSRISLCTMGEPSYVKTAKTKPYSFGGSAEAGR